MLFAGECNKYFNDRAPWHLSKNNDSQVNTVLFLSAKAVYAFALYGQPFLPFTSSNLLAQLGLEKSPLKWGDLSPMKPGLEIKPKPLYEKITDEQVAKETGEDVSEGSAEEGEGSEE